MAAKSEHNPPESNIVTGTGEPQHPVRAALLPHHQKAKDSSGGQTNYAARQPLWRQPKYVAAVLLILLAIIIGFVYSINKKPHSVSYVCDDTIARRANIQNKMANVTTFEQLVNRIKAKPDYANDPNCLYIVTEYQITALDLSAANTSIDNLKSTYGVGYRFNKNLDDGKASIQNLQKQYSLMKDAEDNSKGTIDPGL